MARLPGTLPPIDTLPRGALFHGQSDIFGDSEFVKERGLLADDGDPGAACRRRSERANRISIDLDGAGVRLKRSAEDFDERRFARTVLARNRMDLASLKREGHAVKRTDAAKGLRHGGRMDERRHGTAIVTHAGNVAIAQSETGRIFPLSSEPRP